MKLPFSYQNHFFKPVLVASILGHLAFLGTGSFLFSAPQFGVREAPHSMEIVILKETKVKKEKVREARVLTSEDSPVEEKQIQKKPEPEKPKEVQKPFFSPPEKGAASEAKPDYLKNPAPVYPHLARERGWQGLVILKVLVSTDGVPSEVRVEESSGHGVLDKAALRAVRNWKFVPARSGNFAFTSWVRVPVRFLLVEEA